MFDLHSESIRVRAWSYPPAGASPPRHASLRLCGRISLLSTEASPARCRDWRTHTPGTTGGLYAVLNMTITQRIRYIDKIAYGLPQLLVFVGQNVPH